MCLGGHLCIGSVMIVKMVVQILEIIIGGVNIQEMDQLTVFLLVIVMGAEYKYLVNEQIRQLNYIKSSINKIEVF